MNDINTNFENFNLVESKVKGIFKYKWEPIVNWKIYLTRVKDYTLTNQRTDSYASIRELLVVINSSKDEIEQIRVFLAYFWFKKQE